MTIPEAILALGRARDELAEARRYVTSNPTAALDHVAFAVRELDAMSDDWFDWFAQDGAYMWNATDRLADNLRAACDCILVCPEVLGGYLAGAVFELGVLVARLRKASEEAA